MQSQNADSTDNQETLNLVKSLPTKDSKITSIALNTEATELSFKYHPKIKRFLSEKSLREYSPCNIILTVYKQEAQSDLKNSSQQFYDKVWPRRNSSV